MEWGWCTLDEIEARSLPTNDEIRQLQELLLAAVLAGHALPGGTRPVQFPDLSFVTNQPRIIVVDENLAGPISIASAPKPVEILSREAFEAPASRLADVAYLRFQPPQLEESTVQLTLEAKIAPRNPGQPALGLSGVQVTFQKVAGLWRVIEEPRFFAA